MPVPGKVTDFFGRAIGNNGAVAHEHNALCKVLSLFQVVGCEDNGFAGFGELIHAFPEGAAGGNIHAGGGLIQNEDIGVMHGGDSEPDALLLPAGAFTDLAMRQLGQVCVGKHLINVDAGGIERGKHFEGLPHGQVFEKAAGLQNSPNIAALHRLFRGDTLHGEGSSRRFGQPQNHINESGFARPVWTEQGYDFALADGEVEIIDGSEGAAWNPENLGQILCLNNCCRVHVSSTPALAGCYKCVLS